MVAYFIGFVALVILFLALDLGVFHRDDRIMSTKAALLWTAFWVFVALLFNGLIYILYEYQLLGASNIKYLNGRDASIAFFTAYIVEKSLSIDNIFVIAMIFGYFKVPLKYQHRVLFWGIISALIMRGLMIWLGIEAMERWSFVNYIFGIILLLTACRMMLVKKDKPKPEKNIALRFAANLFPISKEYSGGSFFIRANGRVMGTPLLLVLISIESMDLLFAIDSIPAVFAFTLDPFIVFTSNVFAILGLRSLYFALVSLLEQFRYLKYSLIFILLFVGVKMIISNHFSIDPLISLEVVLGILCLGIIASLLFKRR